MDRYEGFREFVLARGPALSRTAYLLCGNHAGAEELVQEALAKTASHWRRVRDGNPEGYVRRTMVNQHTSWWRKFGRRERPYADVSEMVGGRPDSSHATTERLVLVTALAALAPKQRAAIVLRFYEDLSETEIADALGVANGTVKRNIHDGLRRMRALMPSIDDIELEATT
ncbi:SigE family RNA polymerase sigma factor [Phytomonospora sp. NPDC050363]|uniref:SigE family RNA polymerase sigma factor n=1 Tax=Phytomonospora sp. NPDC050363 TaxID=3155642 RepID=UPI0033ECEE46